MYLRIHGAAHVNLSLNSGTSGRWTVIINREDEPVLTANWLLAGLPTLVASPPPLSKREVNDKLRCD